MRHTENEAREVAMQAGKVVDPADVPALVQSLALMQADTTALLVELESQYATLLKRTAPTP